MTKEIIEEAGSIAAGLCEHLEAKEQAMFIAGFQECAKWQQKNSYSEEEVLVILHKRDMYKWEEENEILSMIDWFEQFKKK